MERFKKAALCFCVFCVIGVIVAGVYLFKPLNRTEMAIRALRQMVKADGSMVYEIDFLENTKSDKKNMVREMGSAYALAFAYNQTHDRGLEKELKKILMHMDEVCLAFGNYYCFIPENKDKIKVGATALGLLAELYYEQTSGDFSFSGLRQKMVRALVTSFKDGKGVMASPYERDRTSPYYDGETWFALSVYHLLHPEDRQVAHILPRIDETMIRIYQDQYLDSFVHWGTMAASHRFRVTNDRKFVNFLKKQFDLYVQEKPTPDSGSSSCSVTEGLSDIAFYLAEAEPDFAQEVLKRVMKNQEKIEALQMISEEIPEENFQYARIHPETRKYIGAFLNKPHHYVTRNDITQHCLIALLKQQRARKNIQNYVKN